MFEDLKYMYKNSYIDLSEIIRFVARGNLSSKDFKVITGKEFSYGL